MEYILRSMFILITMPLICFAQTKVLTVCEVQSDLDRYRGQLITVRGVVSSGYHGSSLGDYDQARKPCPSVLKSGRQWPPNIYLSWPSMPIPDDGPREFVPDSQEVIDQTLSEVRKAVSESRARGEYNLFFIATITGELRSREGIFIFRDEEGSYMGTGYGQGGQYPAQLVIKSVADPQLVDLSEWK